MGSREKTYGYQERDKVKRLQFREEIGMYEPESIVYIAHIVKLFYFPTDFTHLLRNIHRTLRYIISCDIIRSIGRDSNPE